MIRTATFLWGPKFAEELGPSPSDKPQTTSHSTNHPNFEPQHNSRREFDFIPFSRLNESPTMPREVSDIKQFIEICRRKDASCEYLHTLFGYNGEKKVEVAIPRLVSGSE